MDRANDIAVCNKLNLFNRSGAHGIASYGKALFPFRSRETLEDVTGVLAVDGDEEHRTVGHKAPPCFQAVDPGLVTEALRQMHIDSAETQRHRMHTVRCPGGRVQTKAAIEQRVVVQKAVKGPFALVV